MFDVRSVTGAHREIFRLSVVRTHLTILIGCILMAGAAVGVSAHGTEYQVFTEGVVGVEARYATGEPMAQATVLVFAPGETEVTYETGTDKNGVVCIAPRQTGTWILQVRDEGGHGMRINLTVDEDMTIENGEQGNTTLSLLQKVIMAAAVGWGLIGTALFFKGRKTG
jgi:nickel transport protein